MNNRYDIEVHNFSKLGKDDVVIITCDDIDKPSFKVLVYPHGGKREEKYVSVSVRRYIHYPHRVTGLVDSSLSSTVSIVDTEGKERFLKSFGMANFFNLDWFASLMLADQSAQERLVSRNFLFDQYDELLKDDVLTIRVDVSYQVTKPSLEPCDTYEVKSSEVVKGSDIERLESVGLMEESLCELREFVFLYKDLTQLHKMLGWDPDIERLVKLADKSVNIDRFQGFFKDLSDCFRLDRALQKQATGITLYTEHMDEDEVKKVQKRKWINRTSYHEDVVAVLMKYLKEFMDTRGIVLDREKEWERKIELVEARMQLIVRLFHLNEKMKECFHNRNWLDKDAEEGLIEERRQWGERNSTDCLEENIHQMIDQFQSIEGESFTSDGLLKENIHFFINFLSTIELVTDHVFRISGIFFNWIQSLIETNLPKEKPKSKLAKKDVDKEENNLQKEDCDSQQQLEDYPMSEITIETGTGDIVVPSVSKLLGCSPVFKQMLFHPFKEAIEGKLVIKQFDSVTVQDLLSFVDSGGSLREDMDRDEYLSLYFMAHMYQVQSLEERLADCLYSTLCSQTVGYVRKFSSRLGEEHPLCKALDKFYEDMKSLDLTGKGNVLDQEPEFKNGLKDWAREQRKLFEDENNFNFYQ